MEAWFFKKRGMGASIFNPLLPIKKGAEHCRLCDVPGLGAGLHATPLRWQDSGELFKSLEELSVLEAKAKVSAAKVFGSKTSLLRSSDRTREMESSSAPPDFKQSIVVMTMF